MTFPARAPEDALELLNNLPVAVNGTVQTLQVAVDDPDEVVELFTRGKFDRAQRLGLVRLAVAQKGPDLAVARFFEFAVFKIAVKARLIDRHDGR